MPNDMSRLGIQSFFAPPEAPRRPRIRRAEGIWFEDDAGRRTIDVSSGPVASNLGHGNKRVLAAMQAQAELAVFATPSQFESAANIALAEKLAALCGPGLDRAFLTSGGSEAIETAVRFCRQHAVWRGEAERWKVISRMPSYHGNTFGALTLSGDPVAHALFGPMMVTMPKVPAPLTYRVPRRAHGGELRRRMRRRAGAHDRGGGRRQRARLHHGAGGRPGHRRAGGGGCVLRRRARHLHPARHPADP